MDLLKRAAFSAHCTASRSRSARDLDLVLGVLAAPGAAHASATTYRLPPPRRHHLSHYRVAVWRDDRDFPVDAAVLEGIDGLIAGLVRKGVHVDVDERPAFALREAADVYLRLLLPIFSPGPGGHASGQENDATPIEERWMSYPYLSHQQWLAANEARYALIAAWEALFERVDLLLCPPNPVTAFPHDHSEPRHARVIDVNGTARSYLEQFVWVGALAGAAHLPAAVAPVGLSRIGLPTGVQIIGARQSDLTVIHFAAQLEAEIYTPAKPPGF